ncbi:hypothetical protein ACW5R3_06935 [Bizionia sp. KMM 8389]
MKPKFQFHIAFSLLLVYLVNFGVTANHDFSELVSESKLKEQAKHKNSKGDSSSYFAYQDFEIFGHTPTDFETPNVQPVVLGSTNGVQFLSISQKSKDTAYFKTGKLLIPSLNAQTCIFPFHDFT